MAAEFLNGYEKQINVFAGNTVPNHKKDATELGLKLLKVGQLHSTSIKTGFFDFFSGFKGKNHVSM